MKANTNNTIERNPVYYSAQEAWIRYYPFLTGLLSGAVCVVSATPANETTKHALRASMEKLGFGSESITYIALTISNDTFNETNNPPLSTNDSESSHSHAHAGNSVPCSTEDVVLKPTGSHNTTHNAFPSPTSTLSTKQLYGIIEGIDPVVVIALQSNCMQALSRAYDVEFSPKAPAHLLGRTAVGFKDFEELLKTESGKQHIWHHLKKLGSFPQAR